MTATRPDADDPIRWFEVLGGAAMASGETADARALRSALAADDAPVTAPTGAAESSWLQLRERLREVLASEDHQWFEAIGDASAEPSMAADDGHRLRTALARDDSAAPAATGADTQAELLRRLTALGTGPAPARGAGGWWQRWFGAGAARPGLAFAAMLALVVGIGVVWQDRPEHERERSVVTEPRIGPGGAPTFDVANPAGAARGLVAALGAAGVRADASDQGGYWIVRALLPDPPGAAAERLLRERRLDAPPDRLLEVVFVRNP